jgi:hypothetical protein
MCWNGLVDQFFFGLEHGRNACEDVLDRGANKPAPGLGPAARAVDGRDADVAPFRGAVVPRQRANVHHVARAAHHDGDKALAGAE